MEMNSNGSFLGIESKMATGTWGNGWADIPVPFGACGTCFVFFPEMSGLVESFLFPISALCFDETDDRYTCKVGSILLKKGLVKIQTVVLHECNMESQNDDF